MARPAAEASLVSCVRQSGDSLPRLCSARQKSNEKRPAPRSRATAAAEARDGAGALEPSCDSRLDGGRGTPPVLPRRRPAMPSTAFAASPSCTLPTAAGSAPAAVCRRRFLAAATLLAAQRCLPPAFAEAPAGELSAYLRAASGLEVRDFRVGSGRIAAVDDVVVVKWTGRLADRYGWSFQRDDADEVALRLGAGDDVIRGFREGVAGDLEGTIPPMREGGKRRIIIPKGTSLRFRHSAVSQIAECGLA